MIFTATALLVILITENEAVGWGCALVLAAYWFVRFVDRVVTEYERKYK